MSQWPVQSPHDAKADMLVVSLRERRDDGVKRAHSSSKGVGRGGIEREDPASILQNESHTRQRHIRSKNVVLTLNDGGDMPWRSTTVKYVVSLVPSAQGATEQFALAGSISEARWVANCFDKS